MLFAVANVKSDCKIAAKTPPPGHVKETAPSHSRLFSFSDVFGSGGFWFAYEEKWGEIYLHGIGRLPMTVNTEEVVGLMLYLGQERGTMPMVQVVPLDLHTMWNYTVFDFVDNPNWLSIHTDEAEDRADGVFELPFPWYHE